MKENNVVDPILNTLWAVGAIGFFYILYLYFCAGEEGIKNASALAPAGIIISAFIASASVMKSIQNSKIEKSWQWNMSRK